MSGRGVRIGAGRAGKVGPAQGGRARLTTTPGQIHSDSITKNDR